MSELELRHRHAGPWNMNTYALVCPETNESVLVDPGADPDKLEDMLGGSEPIAILLTHVHPDHVGALSDMRQRLGVPVFAHPAPYSRQDPDADELLEDGDTVEVGEHTLNVIHTPGHCPEQICFAVQDDNRIIVGDTIFEGGPGKTWNNDQFEESLQTLRNIVLQWSDDTHCYPGHGPSFRLGDIRSEVERFLARDHGNFYGDATWDM